MKKFLKYKTRSIWKGYSLVGSLKSIKNNRIYVIKKKDLSKEVYIYNGKYYIKFNINLKHIGFKLGQFAITKKIGMKIHLKNIKLPNKKTQIKVKNLKKK